MNQPEKLPTISELIRAKLREKPDERVYTFLGDGETESGTLTYGQVDKEAHAIAAHLLTLSKPGDRALLIYPPGLENITALAGCLIAGLVTIPTLPLVPQRPPEELLRIVNDAQPTLLLTTRAMRDTLDAAFAPYPGLRALACVATDEIPVSANATDWQAPPIDDNTLLLLLYTSGSTRTPRAIKVEQRGYVKTLARARATGRVAAPGLVVNWKPIYHTSGLGEIILRPLIGGTPLVFMPTDAFLGKPVRWLRAITRYRAARSSAPNFGFQLCVDRVAPAEREGLDLSSWVQAEVNTEPVQPNTLKQFVEMYAPYGFRRKAFLVSYGLTEAAIEVTVGQDPGVVSIKRSALEENRVQVVADDAADRVALVSCGKALPGTDVRIVDPATCRMSAPDHIGEIWVGAGSAQGGYWHKEQETAETFSAHLADTKEGPFLRTGDLGFEHDGELYVAGRLRDMIIVHGRNYYAIDIEQVAGRADPALAVGAAAAFAIPTGGAEGLAILHEIKPNLTTVDVDAVAKEIRRVIAQEMRLAVNAVVLVKAGSLPRTPSGKIQRYLARAQYLASTKAEAK